MLICHIVVNHAATILGAAEEDSDPEPAETNESREKASVDDKSKIQLLFRYIHFYDITQSLGKQAHKVIPMIASKKIADNINKWNLGPDASSGINKDTVGSADHVSSTHSQC